MLARCLNHHHTRPPAVPWCVPMSCAMCGRCSPFWRCSGEEVPATSHRTRLRRPAHSKCGRWRPKRGDPGGPWWPWDLGVPPNHPSHGWPIYSVETYGFWRSWFTGESTGTIKNLSFFVKGRRSHDFNPANWWLTQLDRSAGRPLSMSCCATSPSPSPRSWCCGSPGLTRNPTSWPWKGVPQDWPWRSTGSCLA